MTTNQRCKKYLEAHPGATIEDWQNQRHRQHIIQYNCVMLHKHMKHAGSKPLRNLLQVI